MSAADIIAEVKRLFPEDTEEDVLLARIGELHSVIENEIISTHEDGSESYPAGGEEAKNAYIYYLLMKGDADSGDTDSYITHGAQFRDAYGDFADSYNRKHMPITEEIIL